MIDCVEKFNVRGDTLFGDLQGTVITTLDINPALEFRTVWAALNPYYAQVTAGVIGEWSAVGELRFSLNKVIVGKVPLTFSNNLLLPEGDLYGYEMRGAAAGPSLFFGVPNSGGPSTDDLVLFEVPCFPLKIKADKAELSLTKRSSSAVTNFVYGLRIHSQDA